MTRKKSNDNTEHKNVWLEECIIHGFKLSVRVLILPLFSLVAAKKFWVNLCFETSGHSVQTEDDMRKVISQAF